eukprot:COSAG05_NODE_4680_length_1413_cov_6.763318_2_plen_117_part_00
MTHSRSVDSEALTKWAFYSENRGAQPGRETVRMMALWLGASSVGHNPAAALRRGIPRDEIVYPRKVGALRALPKKGGISREPLEEESSARFLAGSDQRRDGECAVMRDRPRNLNFR